MFIGLQTLYSCRGYRDTFLQRVQYQFADGIDLILIGVLQQHLTFAIVCLSQDALQKRFLPPHAIHGCDEDRRWSSSFISLLWLGWHVLHHTLPHRPKRPARQPWHRLLPMGSMQPVETDLPFGFSFFVGLAPFASHVVCALRA